MMDMYDHLTVRPAHRWRIKTVPVKPIYEKAPLKGAVRLPLRPGQLLLEDATLDALLSLCDGMDAAHEPQLWEGMLRASALVTPQAHKLPVAEWIRAALTDAASNADPAALPIMRAAFALYELTADRSLAAAILQWVGNMAANWQRVTGCASIRRAPADMMGLLVDLYRVTGKKPLLRLMDKLRQESMNWAGILHTFAVQQPMSKVTPIRELRQGMAAETSEEGFYTRQALTCHGMTLADGARAAVMNGTYSGNGQELSAAAAGWEKLDRYHGQACGGVSSDELLAGNAPSAGVDSAALGAWLEALCAAMEQDGDADLWQALSLIRANALPKTVLGGKMHLQQQVNALKPDAGDKPELLLAPDADRQVLAMSRLLRGTAAMLSHALCLTPDGVSICLPVTGKCSLSMNGKTVNLTMAASDKGMTVTVACKEPAAFRIRVRMPDHVTGGQVKVSRGGSASCEGGVVKEATRTWESGDTVTMTWAPALWVKQGYHQGAAVYQGDRLMMLADQSAVALCGEPVPQDGRVMLPVADIDPMKVSKGVVSNLPVLPQLKGEVRMAALTPYADGFGLAFFPKGNC